MDRPTDRVIPVYHSKLIAVVIKTLRRTFFQNESLAENYKAHTEEPMQYRTGHTVILKAR